MLKGRLCLWAVPSHTGQDYWASLSAKGTEVQSRECVAQCQSMVCSGVRCLALVLSHSKPRHVPGPISPLEVSGSLFLMCVKGRPVLWGGHEAPWEELPCLSQDLAPGQPFSLSLYLDGLSVLKRRNTLGILFSLPVLPGRGK